MGSYKVCFCFTRKYQWKEVKPPEDVKVAFERYAGGLAQMNAEQLCRFLKEFQREEEATVTSAEMLIERLRQVRHRYIGKLAKPLLTLEDFHHLLFSDELNPPIISEVLLENMNAPLSHYFIYTGHNSYLTGNQLSSDCSDVPIIKALRRGVRVIELDIWPNSSKDDIIVYHGRTLTSPIGLAKCLRSIRDHAFETSPYPVIITLEDHLTLDLQDKVAKIVINTFGDMLFYPESQSFDEFPSPESLKHRILLSTKPPKEYMETKFTRDKERETRKAKKSPKDDEWGGEVSDFDTVELEHDDKNYERALNHDEEDIDDHKHPPEYRRLITITAGKPKGGLRNALKIDPKMVRRLSLSEEEFLKAAKSKSYGKDIVRFTQRNLLRIYPKGTRVDSSNYNPMFGWMYGAQMVALNMQGYGRSLWLMHGFFRANGGCGFVRKPDFLLKSGINNEVFDPSGRSRLRRILKVTVYMGDGWRLDFKQTYFDAYSPPDFYARVGIAGVPADSKMEKTRAMEDNWTPEWDEEFVFPLHVPELALLRIEVHEYDMTETDDFGGQNCLPVSELRQGIRAVPLFDRKGNKLASVKLLMRFQFLQP